MTRPYESREPVAITRLRHRLLTPKTGASELARAFVNNRQVAAARLRSRFVRLIGESHGALGDATTSTAGRVNPLLAPEPRARQHDADADGGMPPERDNERSGGPANEAATSLGTSGDDRRSSTADSPGDQTSATGAGRGSGDSSGALSSVQRAAIARTARHAAEDALRRVRHDQRTLADDLRACRAEPPAFQ